MSREATYGKMIDSFMGEYNLYVQRDVLDDTVNEEDFSDVDETKVTSSNILQH
jgi:hypothetical protein